MKSSKLNPPIRLENKYLIAENRSVNYSISEKAITPAKTNMRKIIANNNENLARSISIFCKILISGPKNQLDLRLKTTKSQSKTEKVIPK